jgi:phospholipid transport system substrate-binding protein|tara:strand:+ start:229 stop:828 length:600 start_codon:yes stop_codon:yes gene_type:complete
MNRFFLSAIILIFTINISYSVTYNSEPKIFITELIQDAMKTLSDKSISLEDKRKIIEKIALENVDINAIGKYTLGDFRKTLDDSNSRKYDDLFEKYFLKSLTSRLTDYSNNKFEIISAEQKSSKYTIVKSKISESSSQPEIQIDWRVYTKDPLKPLIRDLVVEGLSLARTQKEEFSSILSANNNDVNFLFARLEKFIAN